MKKQGLKGKIALWFDIGTRSMLVLFLAWCAYRVFMNLLYLPGMAIPHGFLFFVAALLALELVFSLPLGYAVLSLLETFAASLGARKDAEADPDREAVPAAPCAAGTGDEMRRSGAGEPAAREESRAQEETGGGAPMRHYVFIGPDGSVALETDDPGEAERFRQGLL